MVILKSLIFNKYPEIIFGFSTKIGNGETAPYFFNLSLSAENNKDKVLENRKKFFNSIELKPENAALQKQIHGDTVFYAAKGGLHGESDAMITDKTNLGLAISTADCCSVFIYNKSKKIIAGVHSGWRGTKKKILLKSLMKLKEDFNSLPEDLIVYLGPSISQKNYEVGEEVAQLFDKKYLKIESGKILLDLTGVNYDILINFGLKKENIQASTLCTYDTVNLLHSYRRDGEKSGRTLGVIALKK